MGLPIIANYQYNSDNPDAALHPPVILIHGLFAASDNLRTIAKKLSDHVHVIAVDLRNHGASFHHSDTSYEAMALDIIALLDHLKIPKAVLLGHSMGGKTAMRVAVSQPGRICGLIIEDIGPGAHPSRYANEVKAMAGFDPGTVSSRKEARDEFMKYVDDPRLALFLLKNLSKNEDGTFYWRHNISGIAQGYDEVWKSPVKDGDSYTGPVLCIKGAKSNAINENDMILFRELFTSFEIKEIAETGHWVHAEKPDEFVAAVTEFISKLPAT